MSFKRDHLLINPDVKDTTFPELSEFIDKDALQTLMDDFSALTKLPVSIIDRKGKVITRSGWQELCTRFHRKNPDSCKNCLESDTSLSAGVKKGEFKIYKCKNNLQEITTPIYVENEHVGNLHVSQFFFEDEEIDYKLFESQAKTFGFNQSKYIEALNEVQRLSRSSVMKSMNFLIKLAGLISSTGHTNLKLKKLVAQKDKLMQAVSTERQMLRTLMDNLPDAIYVKDKNARKILANLADLENIGVDSEMDVLGKTDFDVFPHEIAAKFYDDDKYILETGTPVINREESLVKAGKRRILLTSKLPLFDQNGQINGLMGIGRDITEREQFTKQIIAAKEKAEESDRLKTSFLNNLSHEIRTPLNAIVGFSDFLCEPGLSSENFEKYTRIIRHSSDQLLSIINDIIHIASLEAEQEKAHLRETDINKILHFLYDQFKVRTDTCKLNLKLSGDLKNKDAMVLTDETKLIQVLTNLLTNALKFTDDGEVEFGCSIINNDLRFYVRDTGIGIKEEFHEIIFERFRQVNLSKTRIYGGTGLGLSIAKSFVELMGGSIWLESEQGKGTCFYFTIPWKPSRPDDLITCPDNHKFTSNINVLIAEDDLSNFILINEILSSENCNIVHAQNGKEAIEALKANPGFDLVLMDIKMPVMDGYQAVKQIKALNPNMPVIAITAHALQGAKEEALSQGFDDYVAKPITRKSLMESVSKHIIIENKKIR